MGGWADVQSADSIDRLDARAKCNIRHTVIHAICGTVDDLYSAFVTKFTQQFHTIELNQQSNGNLRSDEKQNHTVANAFAVAEAQKKNGVQKKMTMT